MHLNKKANPGNQWAPNKNGGKAGRKCVLNRGHALIKQMRLTTSRYGTGIPYFFAVAFTVSFPFDLSNSFNALSNCFSTI